MSWRRVETETPLAGDAVLVAHLVGMRISYDVATRVPTPAGDVWLTAEWTCAAPTWWQPLPDPPESP